MKTTVIIAILAAVILVTVVALLARKQYDTAVKALPPSETASYLDAVAFAAQIGGEVTGVKGTGSMSPYIPGGAPDSIVAYVVTFPTRYVDLRQGDLVIYRSEDKRILHQIASREGNGWIASGLSNPVHDRARVNEGNYVGKVAKTFILPENERL